MSNDGTDICLSPYQVAIGPSLDGLHPELSAYFSSIPRGYTGIGRGTWDRVGTPRRWLWPVLWLLAKEGIVFPVWGQGVPFTVRNSPDSSGDGPSVRAYRTFSFPSGDRVMVDCIGLDKHGLVDTLGRTGRLVARLEPSIIDGTLAMRSTSLLVRFGRRHLTVPQGLAPWVELTESFDDTRKRQHVALTLTAPVIGRIYEYSGYFDYAIERVEG